MKKCIFLFMMLVCVVLGTGKANAYDITFNKQIGNHGITISYDASTGIYTVATVDDDPYITTQKFKRALEDTECMFSFEYKCEIGKAPWTLQLFFANPIQEARSAKFDAGFVCDGEWHEFKANIKPYKEKFKWGLQTNLLRIDIGEVAGCEFQMRNAKIREMNEEELEAERKRQEWEKYKNDMSAHLNKYLGNPYSSKVETVTVADSSVTITGKCVGNGKFQLVDVAPYDEITETKRFAERVALADKEFTVTVPRYMAKRDGYPYDRALSKWAIVDSTEEADVLQSTAIYATDMAAKSSPEAQPLLTKKGLGNYHSNAYGADLDSLQVKSVTINVVLNNLISTYKVNKNWAAKTFNGKRYYYSKKALQNYDALLKNCAERKIVTSAILLVPYYASDSTMVKTITHPESTGGNYAMPNLTDAKGVNTFAAMLSLLAERYSGETYGRFNHWIILNEVDAGTTWANMGDQPLPRYIDAYQKTMRMCYNILRQYDQNASVLASFTHTWAGSAGEYTTLNFLNQFMRYDYAEGDYRWGLAYHPYPQDLSRPRFWEDDKESTYMMNSPYCTFKNLEVVDAWVRNPAHYYMGNTKRVLFLSENGTNSPSYSEKDLTDQAAGACWAWKKVSKLEGIDGIQWHNWIDNKVEGFRLGLRYYPDDETYKGAPKPVWYVWQAAGTEKEDSVFEKYKSVIGISSWDEIFHETGVAVVKTAEPTLKAWGAQGTILVADEKPVEVYSMMGALVARGTNAINVPAGLYVVKRGSSSVKVVVR